MREIEINIHKNKYVICRMQEGKKAGAEVVDWEIDREKCTEIPQTVLVLGVLTVLVRDLER